MTPPGKQNAGARPPPPVEGAEIDQPGLDRLRTVIETTTRAPGEKKAGGLGRDALAGLTGAINAVPDGMASATLAGVNPVYGLYASILGPLAGGLFASTQLMVVATTSAGALVAGQSLAALPFEGRGPALFLLVLLSGAVQVLLGLLRLGRLVRFVSFSVMTGLISGVAVLLILSQLSTVTGIEVPEANTVVQAWQIMRKIDQAHWPTLWFAISTVVIAVGLGRTRLRIVSTLLAIGLPSIVLALFGVENVQIVREAGEIPRGLPAPALPDFSLITPELVSGAVAAGAGSRC